MDILQKINLFSMDEGWKKVIRKGKARKKLICPVDGMKAKDGKCVVMKPAEKKNVFKAALKRGKKMRSMKGMQKKAARKRAKSMMRRAMQIGEKYLG